MPFLATLGQVLASALIERTGLVKYQFIHFAAVHRLLWLVAAALPLVLPIPSSVAVVSLLAVLAASWFMSSLATPAWMTWMGVLIPRRVRGRYFANRGRLAMLVQVAVVVAIGIAMDRIYPTRESIRPGAGLWAICGILALGAVLGTIDILLFRRVPEVLPPPVAAKPDAGAVTRSAIPAGRVRRRGSREALAWLGRYVLEPLRDSAFRSYVLFGATMAFSLTVAGWFFWLNAMDHLGFGSLAANVLFLVVGPLGGIWTSRWWGRAIDRWGRRPILFVGTVGAVLCLVPWLLIAPDMPGPSILRRTIGWVLSAMGDLLGQPELLRLGKASPVGAYLVAALSCALGGASWTGVNLAQVGIVLGFADGNGRSRYVAASSVLISVGGMLGGLAGGVLTESLRFLQDAPLRLGPIVWNNWHVAFAAALLSRCLAVLWLIGMPDPGAAKIRAFTRHVGVNTYNALVTRLFNPVRVFGWALRKRRSPRPPRRHRSALGKAKTEKEGRSAP
jgi:MFS family permease